MFRIFLTGFGILLLVTATVLVSLLGWLASKGLVTSKGLILDPRAQGHVLPVSVAGLIAFVLSFVIFGIVNLILAKSVPLQRIRYLPKEDQK